MYLGSFTEANKGESVVDATLRYEKMVGYKSATTRHYTGLDQPWDGSGMLWSAGQGKIQVIAMHSRINRDHAVLWRDVANGDHDDKLRLRAQELMSYDGFAYLIWHHEPENDANAWFNLGPDQDGPSGDPGDYVAAGLHVRKIIRDEGVPASRGLFGQCLMAGTYGTGHGGYDNWRLPFPILAVDGYDREATKSFSDLFVRAQNVARLNGRTLFVEEAGTVEDPNNPNYKADWFADAQAEAASWPELVGVEYSNVSTSKGDYRIDSSPQALAAYKAWAASTQ